MSNLLFLCAMIASGAVTATIILSILKWTAVVDWSWWLVTAPLWLVVVLAVLLGWIVYMLAQNWQ